MIDPLSELAILNGTDKFGLHDYTPNYHRLFAPFRDRPVRLLEIGVGGYSDEDRGGRSLATWRDYFPHGQITGIDIQRKALDLGDRVRILQGSQVDAGFLARVVAERGPFDLVVDDGSHRNEHVVETFRLLWPTLALGGCYVVEDAQTAFMPRFGGSLELAQPNTVGLFAAMLGELGGEVARITRVHNMVALDKPGGPERPWAGGEPVETLPGDAGEAEVRGAWAALPAPGLLRIEGPLGPEALALLRRLFVQVDHREVAVAFPGTAADPMAPWLQRLEVEALGATLRKAPNDYPSNFAFDPDHPEAAAALRAMAEVLEGCGREEGVAAYASLLTTLHGREAAGPWVRRLEGMGATSRAFHQLAGGLAQRERRTEDARRHYAAGVARFPDDAVLVQGLVGALMTLDRTEEARSVLVSAILASPRDAALHLLMARLADRMGDAELAVEHGRVAIALSGGARRAPALVAMADALLHAGRHEDAAAAYGEAGKLPGKHGARAARGLSAAQAALGLWSRALGSAREAVRLAPEERSHRDWAERLALRAAAACPPGEGRDSLVA